MDGSANPRGEHWIAENGDPVFAPYAHPFTGDYFDTDVLDEILN